MRAALGELSPCAHSAAIARTHLPCTSTLMSRVAPRPRGISRSSVSTGTSTVRTASELPPGTEPLPPGTEPLPPDTEPLPPGTEPSSVRCSSFRSLTSMVLPRLARGTSMRARAVAVRPMATGMTTTRLETLSSGRLTWSILRLRVRKKRFAGEGSKATMLARVRRRSSTVHAPTLAPISSNTPSGSPGMGSDGRDEGTGTSRPCHKRVYMPQSRHDPLLTIRSETTCFHRDSNLGR